MAPVDVDWQTGVPSSRDRPNRARHVGTLDTCTENPTTRDRESKNQPLFENVCETQFGKLLFESLRLHSISSPLGSANLPEKLPLLPIATDLSVDASEDVCLPQDDNGRLVCHELNVFVMVKDSSIPSRFFWHTRVNSFVDTQLPIDDPRDRFNVRAHEVGGVPEGFERHLQFLERLRSRQELRVSHLRRHEDLCVGRPSTIGRSLWSGHSVCVCVQARRFPHLTSLVQWRHRRRSNAK